MRYLKLYEDFQSDDINSFDYIIAIKEIIENALNWTNRNRNSQRTSSWFVNSIELNEDVIVYESEEIQNGYKDEIQCEIDELHGDSVRLLIFGYDSGFLLDKTFVDYEDLDDWTIKEIWDFLQKSMKNGDIDIHDKWYVTNDGDPNL